MTFCIPRRASEFPRLLMDHSKHRSLEDCLWLRAKPVGSAGWGRNSYPSSENFRVAQLTLCKAISIILNEVQEPKLRLPVSQHTQHFPCFDLARNRSIAKFLHSIALFLCWK